jgi:hypothetical protein
VVDAAFVAAQRDELAQLARWLSREGTAPVFDELTRSVALARVRVPP